MRLVVATLSRSQTPAGSASGPPSPAVGIVRHRYAGERALTVVVKAAFRYGDGEEATLDPEPGVHGAISLDRTIEGELVYASDLVPRKDRADVLLVGHAHGPRSDRLEAAVHVANVGRDSRSHADLERRFFALAGRPSGAIPLAAAYLREPDAITPTRAGPASVPAALGEDSFDPDFDFSVFNSAHPLQRTDLVERDATIDLTHLCASSPRRRIRLPGLAPRVLVDCGDGEGALVDPPCDTVWIDTDEERIVLVWRGVVLVAPSLVERLIVSLEPAEAARDERAIRRAVPRARFSLASEADRVPPAAQDEDEEDELLVARYTALCAEDGVDPTISMDEYATVSAELAEAGPARADVLSRHDLTEDTWLLEERGWMERLTTAAEAGDATPAIEYGEAFRAAQERLAKPVPETSLEDYAAMCAAMEVEDTGKVLARHKLTLPAWSRLDNSWSDRIDEDPALASRFEVALAAARESFPESSEEGSA